MNTKLRTIKIISRTALGLVWFYEGLVPKILFLRVDETGIDPANSRRRADAGRPLANHRICGTNCRVHRDIMDVDLDRAGRVRKSVDADRSLRRAGKRFLLDRMRDHGVDPRAAPILVWVARSLPAVAGVSRKRSCASNEAAPMLPYIENEFKD